MVIVHTHSMAGQQRDQWRSQYDFLLCLIGYSVGVGNIWRFPYLCYKYGGGTFVIPYLVMLLLIGIPTYTMELAIGQYARQTPNMLFKQLAPLFSGVGYGIIIINIIISFNYIMVIAWIIFFTGASFTSQLAWSRCGHSYNTAACFTIADDKQCQNNSLGSKIFWNNSCYPLEELREQLNFTISNISYCNNKRSRSSDLENNRTLSSEEYFSNFVLGMKNYDRDGFSPIRWDISLCLLCAWLLVGGSIFQGIHAFGKILNFTVIFPYCILIILLMLTVTLDGASQGISFYLKPDLSGLKDPAIWTSAATQVFYSLGCSQGGLIAMASFNRRNNNCMRDAILVALVNTLTSVLAAFILFSMLGFIAQLLCRDITRVVTSDLGMAFVAYPEILTHMPLPPVFAALFFLMLITLGIDTQFIAMESLVIAAIDEWPTLRRRRSLVVVGMCALFFVCNLSMCMDGGVLVFALIDHYAFSFSLCAMVLLQMVAVGWVYGAERLLEHMQRDMGIVMPRALYRYWQLSWRVGVPAVTTLGLAYTMHSCQQVSYRGKSFPPWADVVGLLLMFGPTVMVALVALAKACTCQDRTHRWRELLRPTADWGVGRPDMPTDGQPNGPEENGGIISTVFELGE